MYQKTVLNLGLLAAIALIPQAQAGGATPGVNRVQLIASTCNNCHGPGGQSLGATPSLAGLDKAYLRQAMMECKTGVRDTTVMRKYMLGYTDEEIAQLADYFASIK